ncbi:uncharacterized protein LOC132310337 [Cornus florida]|uniref:uncharacterized protein LOC132310337 n=1 Tax=Cornus florida TaxID=4283 RepID=UPI00289B112B|nr:uncharacterized protein LOC132310337 [Cornus florida]
MALQWIAVLIPSLICAAFLDYGFSSILFTALVLILSSIFFIFSKQKTVKDEANSFDQLECFPQVEEVVPKLELEKERTITQNKEGQEGGVGQIDDHLVRPPDSFSESESIDHSSTSEDSEVDWPYSGNVGQDCSDDSISDEESLIEIALPSGHYVGAKEEDSMFHLQPKLADFSPESIFRQHNLVELLAEINEMNEEDNLIEIDISMGSIKCSRFEIEA